MQSVPEVSLQGREVTVIVRNFYLVISSGSEKLCKFLHEDDNDLDFLVKEKDVSMIMQQ